MISKRILAGAGLSLALLTACSTPAEEPTTGAAASADGYTIGVANFMLSGPYFSGMDKAIAAQAQKKGNIEIISTDANGDAAKLASNVEDLLTKNVDAVIISGGPLESAPAVLNSLKAAGKPVVLVDRKFPGEYTSWIGPDNEAIGRQNGEFLSKALPDGGKVAIIKGGPADNTIGSARTNGVKSVLSANSKFTLVEAPDFGGWGSDGGLTVMESLLAGNKDIKAVFCENDAMCLGAQRAIADAGLSDGIIIAGVDGQAEALKAILDDTNYKVTGLNDADIIGAKGLDRAVEILGGATVEKDTVVDSPMVTKDNAAQFQNPDGSF